MKKTDHAAVWATKFETERVDAKPSELMFAQPVASAHTRSRNSCDQLKPEEVLLRQQVKDSVLLHEQERFMSESSILQNEKSLCLI